MAGNGDVPASQLTYVQDGIQLELATAAAWIRMKNAAARSQVRLTVAAPAGGYRSLAVQQDMRDHPERYNLNPNSSVPLAPVGQSTHGYGTRVDVGTASGNAWAIDYARGFGFVREFGTRDPNHYQFTGATAPEPAPPGERTDVMEALIVAPNGTVVHFGPGIRYDFASAADYDSTRNDIEYLRGLGAADMMALPTLGNAAPVSWETYTRLCRYFNVRL